MQWGVAAVVLVALNAGVCWWAWHDGWHKGAAVGRAEVASFQMVRHPQAKIEIPGGYYDFARVAPKLVDRIYYGSGTVVLMPASTSPAPPLSASGL